MGWSTQSHCLSACPPLADPVQCFAYIILLMVTMLVQDERKLNGFIFFPQPSQSG